MKYFEEPVKVKKSYFQEDTRYAEVPCILNDNWMHTIGATPSPVCSIWVNGDAFVKEADEVRYVYKAPNPFKDNHV